MRGDIGHERAAGAVALVKSPRDSLLLHTMGDSRLAELAAGGRHDAFEVLVRRHSPALMRYCRRMGLSGPRAEDALQNALMRAWLALEAGTEVREPRAWLYRIVHNSALNVLRSSPDLLRPLEDASGIEAAASGAPDAEHRMAARAALSSVADLPAMQREAILMSALDGRSHEEVAHALGVSDGAVRGLLYRARATLRAAAAALTPQPLIGWLTRPAATRVGDLCAQGSGSDLGPVLMKGAAVAVTAAVLAAGAAEVHIHDRGPGRPAPVIRAGAPAPSATASAAAEIPAEGIASRPATGARDVSSSSAAAPADARPVASREAAPPTATSPLPAPAGAGTVGQAPAPVSVSSPAAPVTHVVAGPAAVPGESASGAGSSPGTPSVGAGGEEESGQGASAGSGSDDGQQTPEGGGSGSSDDGSAGAGGSDDPPGEREHEQAHEQAERETEDSRTLSKGDS